MRKILPIALALCLLIVQLPANAATPKIKASSHSIFDDLPVEWQTVGKYSYVIRNGQAIITRYASWNPEAPMPEDLVVPNEIEGAPVVAIWKVFCPTLRSVVMPDSVIEIGPYAFANSPELTSVRLSKNLQQIHEEAFARCHSLTEVKIEKGLRKLGNSAFALMPNLRKLTIPRSVTFIPYDLCAGSPLVRIYGYIDTAAERYALGRNIPFYPLDDDPVEKVKITLSASNINLYSGQRGKLSYTLTSASGTQYPVELSTSNPYVADIDQDGNITTEMPGHAQIMLQVLGGDYPQDMCTVNVFEPIIMLRAVPDELTLAVGDNGVVTLRAYPSGFPDDTDAIWTIEDSSIATIVNPKAVNARFTAKRRGTTIARCVANDPNQASCIVKINVVNKGEAVDSVNTEKSVKMRRSQKMKLSTKITPSTALNKSLSWMSSDESVVSVSDTGEITALNDGIATVTAVSSSGKSAKCRVEVGKGSNATINRLKFNKTRANVQLGKAIKLKLIISPKKAQNAPIEWSSSNTSVASVDDFGNVNALELGTTTITAMSASGKTASCAVTVMPRKVESVRFPEKSGTLFLDADQVLPMSHGITASVLPETAANKRLVWNSSNKNVATVDSQTGEITILKTGSTTIRAKASDGSKKTASYKLVVKRLK